MVLYIFQISFFKQRLFIVFIICQSCLLQQFHFRDTAEFVPRIVQGTAAKLGDVPFQVAFKKRIRGKSMYSTFCGGSIISNKKIVSAAHCFQESSWFNFNCNPFSRVKKVKSSLLRQVLVVAANLKNDAKLSDNEGQWRRLSHGVYPSDYRFPRADIAVIVIEGSFVFNNHVSSIPLATRHIEYNMKCQASGYGRLSTSQNIKSPILYYANMDIVPTNICNVMHRRNMRHTVCTSSVVPDTAQGDSGGPLICTGTGDPADKGQGILAGVVSGHRIGTGSFFTRVSSYNRFITRNSDLSSEIRHINSIRNVILTIYVTFCLF
ncbi:transmembrane protease serine 9-like [Plodia interpunctella]|uniref:transmembrane protease serine 9-like n=1 Tax=Plodia interpunctella TaxID=58824 RepID=UPI0023674661|nr:transmembrane protease serine 9-like [Plodia interpunctella]